MDSDDERTRRARHRATSRWAAAVAVTGLVLGGCAADATGESAEPASDAGPTEPGSTGDGAEGLPGGEGVAVDITVVDHGYEGLPEQVAVGSLLSMQTTDEGEFHQLAVYRLDDDETRTVGELATLPLDTDAPDAIGNGMLEGLVATPVAGLSAPPGNLPARMFHGSAPGSFTIELAEPGRYLLIGTLPVGTKVLTAIDAENSGDYSSVQDGPFHYQEGEIAIVDVVGD